ncbi:hypothetical protein ABJ851_002600 [Shigella flexneri]|nr:hypothetical protein [Escherichia coli]
MSCRYFKLLQHRMATNIQYADILQTGNVIFQRSNRLTEGEADGLLFILRVGVIVFVPDYSFLSMT